MQNSRDTVNNVQIASPCSQSWDQMEGDDKVRYCKSCRLNVFNISAMDVEEAAERIANASDRLCVRMYRRQDGTVLTRDCPVGLRARMRRRVAALSGSLAAGLGLLVSLALRPTAWRSPTVPTGVTAPTLFRIHETEVVMGDMAPPTPLETVGEMLPGLPSPEPEMGQRLVPIGPDGKPLPAAVQQ